MTEEAQTQDVKLPELPEPAREAESAGASWRNSSPDYFTADQMREYAICVAADQVRAAVMAERERAAKLVDALADDLWSDGPIGIRAEQCAAAIRSGS